MVTSTFLMHPRSIQTCLCRNNPYLHEEDVIRFSRFQDLPHLLGIHGKRLLTQHILFGVGEEQTGAKVVGVDDTNIHYVCIHTSAREKSDNISPSKFEHRKLNPWLKMTLSHRERGSRGPS